MGNQISSLDAGTALSRGSFAAATMTAGYLFYKCMKPPQPLRLETSREKASPALMRAVFKILTVYRLSVLGFAALNALAALTDGQLDLVLGSWARSPALLDPAFVSWNPKSAAVLFTVASSAALRLHAMGELGANFSFDLHDPNRLVTDGMYRYVQHPSYTTAVIALTLGTTWFLRADGGLAPLLTPDAQQLGSKIALGWNAFVGIGLVYGIRRRVSEEETMLRNKFGSEWEAWHKKTPRFVPFLF